MGIVRIRLRSHAGARGRLTLREWAVPPGGHLWVPSPNNGPLIQQLLAAGFHMADEERTPNEVLDNGRNLIRDFLKGEAVTSLADYAVGTDATAPTKAQNPQRLLAEVYRGTISSFSTDVAKLIVEFFLPSSQANGSTLVEAGPFGNGADGTANSGTCYARAVYSARVKDNTKAFTYSHELTW